MTRTCPTLGSYRYPATLALAKTHRAGQIATIGEVHVGQRGVRGMHAAEPAAIRTRLGAFDMDSTGRGYRQSSIPPSQVEIDIAEHDVAKRTLLATELLHPYIAVFLEDPGSNDLRAFRAQRLGCSGLMRAPVWVTSGCRMRRLGRF